MSSPVTGEEIKAMAKRGGVVTWAALAAFVQLGGIVLPGAMRLSAVEVKVEAVQKDGVEGLHDHITESNARYTEIVRQLTRIEAKLER